MLLILLIIGLAFPRVVLFILWLTTTWLSAVDLIVGLLGFIFLPYTLLWYVVVLNVYGGVFGFWQLLILAVAVLADLFGHFWSWNTYYYVPVE